MIPMVDLKALHRELAVVLDEAIGEVKESNCFLGGPVVERFCESFAQSCGLEHTVACSNGTEALRLAILAVLGEGDGRQEIITVSFTFGATAEAIVAAGYRPVFVDVDPNTCLMELAQLDEVRSARTVGVVPVHLYGQMVDMRRLSSWARGQGLAVIEDAAQAHGALYDGISTGELGEAAAFSFYPGKNLGAWGDAGAVVCRNESVASRLRMLIDHGRSDKFTHEFVSGNSRMDALQAAILLVKLDHLPSWNVRRRDVARRYAEGLSGVAGVRLPFVQPHATHVYHQFAIQVEDRGEFRQFLAARGVSTGIHYPKPVHVQPAFREYIKGTTDLQHTTHASNHTVSLPICPMLSDDNVDIVVRAVFDFVECDPRVLDTRSASLEFIGLGGDERDARELAAGVSSVPRQSP